MLSHLAHLFFAIAFPFKTRRFMADHAKTTHVIEMIIILVLGSLPSIITINISGYQFSEFLPYMYVCTSRDRDVFFYTFLLPIVIGATIGLPMLFTTFWLLRRVSIKFYVLHINSCVCMYVCTCVYTSTCKSVCTCACVSRCACKQHSRNHCKYRARVIRKLCLYIKTDLSTL